MSNTIPSPGSFGSAVVAVPSDTALQFFAAFFVGVAGAVSFSNEADVTITLAAVPAYTVIPCTGRRIRSTGTVATNIILLS